MIFPALNVFWEMLKRTFYVFYAWLPEPFDSIAIYLIGIMAILLIIHIALKLKNIFFQWL